MVNRCSQPGQYFIGIGLLLVILFSNITLDNLKGLSVYEVKPSLGGGDLLPK